MSAFWQPKEASSTWILTFDKYLVGNSLLTQLYFTKISAFAVFYMLLVIFTSVNCLFIFIFILECLFFLFVIYKISHYILITNLAVMGVTK